MAEKNSNGLASRCMSRHLLVPKDFGVFESAITSWISTCVASRTKRPDGKAIRREIELVTGNPSLKAVWMLVAHLRGTDMPVVVEADYQLVNSGKGDMRVSGVEFSTETKPPSKSSIPSIPSSPKKPKPQLPPAPLAKSIPSKNFIERLVYRRQRALLQLNVLFKERTAAEKEAIRLREWATGKSLDPSEIEKMVKGIKFLHDVVKAPDATDIKISATSKARHLQETRSMLEKAYADLDGVYVRIDSVMLRLRAIDEALQRLTGDSRWGWEYSNNPFKRLTMGTRGAGDAESKNPILGLGD
ncbi:MAG: hypothetical protein GY814_02985 [Gammaproteobacteria bacterium]|nr:hypothetical protein [Gammaproteobacteria bacterium]